MFDFVVDAWSKPYYQQSAADKMIQTGSGLVLIFLALAVLFSLSWVVDVTTRLRRIWSRKFDAWKEERKSS